MVLNIPEISICFILYQDWFSLKSGCPIKGLLFLLIARGFIFYYVFCMWGFEEAIQLISEWLFSGIQRIISNNICLWLIFIKIIS